MNAATAIEFHEGAFSVLPDTPWLGGCIANNGCGELRAVGIAGDCRSIDGLELRAEADCVVAVDAIAAGGMRTALPHTWNDLQAMPTQHVGCLALEAAQPALLTSESARQALQAAAREGRLGLVVRRLDHGYETIRISGRLRRRPVATTARTKDHDHVTA